MPLDRSVAKNANDEKLFDNIEQYDCHVISVANAEGQSGPVFSYSIGLAHSLNAAELLIIGLGGNLAHAMINGYRDAIKKGAHSKPGISMAAF